MACSVLLSARVGQGWRLVFHRRPCLPSGERLKYCEGVLQAVMWRA